MCIGVGHHNGGVTDAEDPPGEFATYPSGLRLHGRRVVVVGGGHVAQRRVPGLLAVGAEVVLVSPQVTPRCGTANRITDSRPAHLRISRS